MAPSEEQKLALRIGAQLARVRLRRGYSQEQVAEQMGLNVESISRFERGATLPTLPRLFELADVYGIPVNEFLRRGSSRPADVGEDLVHTLSHLGEADRAWVSEWLTELCERLRHARPSPVTKSRGR